MATISAFHSLSSICRVNSRTMPNHSSSMSRPIRNLHLHLHLQSRGVVANFSKHRTVSESRGVRKIRSVAEETLIPAEEEDSNNPEASPDQPVSVPVSPSDMLTMIFQAEGTMNETAIPTVTKALEEKEGISNLKVKVLEGIASVELTKQTTVQATGVASSLVETIQGSGFKLQTLNLSFEDEEDIIN